MPPRTRGVKAPKASKENINILSKKLNKTPAKVTRAVRKPLADKTNSASDENASPELPKKVTKKTLKSTQKPIEKDIDIHDEDRPRRNRRLPTRYVENHLLNNLSNIQENASTPTKNESTKTPNKATPKLDSPFKTPQSNLDNSLLADRPRRVSRLPSKFEDHSVSPNKFVPVQPCHTSTPVSQKLNSKASTNSTQNNKEKAIQKAPLNNKRVMSSLNKSTDLNENIDKRNINKNKQITPKKSVTDNKKVSSVLNKSKESVRNVKHSIEKRLTSQKKDISPKSNNKKAETITDKDIEEVVNGRQGRSRRVRKLVEYKEVTLSPKPNSPEISKNRTDGKRILNVNSSFKVLEEKKSKNNNQDVYEFTFDPTEEPVPQKKKKRNVIKKKPTEKKPKVFNNNYERNLARALADLKNVVLKQGNNPVEKSKTVPRNNEQNESNKVQVTAKNNGVGNSVPKVLPNVNIINTVAEIHNNTDKNTSLRSNLSTKNHGSIRVEDIAADFEATIDNHDNINYSPISSPYPIIPENERETTTERGVPKDNDPLNLRNELSFFDEPVASSSMNASTRNPAATPWRVEFENLPIKWQANTYVKPDMTPALESSFINNFDDSKKKHVYTNMVPQTNDSLPEIQNEPKLKQTSIISFIKEVVERSASKKKRGSATPTKANSMFDASCTSLHSNIGNKTPKNPTPSENKNDTSKNTSSENDTSVRSSKRLQKRKNDETNEPPAKVPRKDNDANNTLFGFDDSENQEQENVSPSKNVDKRKLRGLRPRSRAVLKEINEMKGPMRAVVPAAMKSKFAPSSEAVEKIYEEIKSATDAPQFPDKGTVTTNVQNDVSSDDDQSVHLFEDIELVHHLKPTRKSYGKSKKVTFRQHSSDSSDGPEPNQNQSSDEEDLDDLSFHLPAEVKMKKVTKKKKNKKNLLSKKEKAEVDAWAAGFNSMCEDIEEFDLVVE